MCIRDRDNGFEALENVNSPKVVLNKNRNALYFSRSIIPMEEAEKMDMKGLPGITSAVQDVVANNAAIISLTGDILSSRCV